MLASFHVRLTPPNEPRAFSIQGASAPFDGWTASLGAHDGHLDVAAGGRAGRMKSSSKRSGGFEVKSL